MSRRRAVDDALGVIAQRFHEPLSLDEIASAAGVSVYHLCRIFHRQVGVTIHRYVMQLRLRTSLEWILDGAPRLVEVALGLGFCSEAHCNDRFRGEFGVSPGTFRANRHGPGHRDRRAYHGPQS